MRDTPIEMKRANGEVVAAVGPPTALYSLALTDADRMPQRMRFLLNRPGTYRTRDDGDAPLDAAFARFVTVSLRGAPDHQAFAPKPGPRSIAEAALFNLAFSSGMSLWLSDSWERTLRRTALRREERAQFPVRTYTSELVAYYQMALGSESLVLSYLALYKILEYFFTSATEGDLHQRVRDRLVQPDFSHTRTAKLRELVATVRRFDQKTDERRMLQIVLDSMVDQDGLREFVQDDDGRSSYFTGVQVLFGKEWRVDLAADQLIPTVANRIYHVRNALVHHKEGEAARFVPYSGQEVELSRELPLIQFLAEQLIVSTGKDLSW